MNNPGSVEHEEAVGLIIRAMETVDMGPPRPEGRPGVNDPTNRVAAFCYGAEIACRPLVEAYMAGEPDDLQAIFDRTFRLSFHFSAGVPLIQSMYQARIGRLLREKYGAETLDDAAEQATFDPASAVLPRNHAQGKGMKRADERAPAIWQFYMDILKSADDLGSLAPADKMREKSIGFLSTFGSKYFYELGLPYFLLKRECLYLENGRPNKEAGDKRYRSDIIDHALNGKPIGNPEFNLIFSEMGITLDALRRLSITDLPDFYLISETKKMLSKLEEQALSQGAVI